MLYYYWFNANLINKICCFALNQACGQSPFFTVTSNNSLFQQQQQNHTDTQQELMERIKHEAKRLIKRRQLSDLSTVNTSATSTDLSMSPESSSKKVSSLIISDSKSLPSPVSSSVSLSSAPSVSTTSNLITSTSSALKSSLLDTKMPLSKHSLKNHNDLPLFSMNQVNQICSGMIREREQLIREQYDKILAEKLSEQYDSFVKFTHEQIQRRFENSQCSYVS